VQPLKQNFSVTNVAQFQELQELQETQEIVSISRNAYYFYQSANMAALTKLNSLPY